MQVRPMTDLLRTCQQKDVAKGRRLEAAPQDLSAERRRERKAPGASPTGPKHEVSNIGAFTFHSSPERRHVRECSPEQTQSQDPNQDYDHESLTSPLLNGQHRSTNSTSQVAIVGVNLCPIESLDYEIAENDFFKQDWRTRGKIQIFQYIFMKWLLCFLIGGIVSLVGFCNNLAVENMAGVKFVITSNMMLAGRYETAFLVFSLSNLGLTLFAAIITTFIAPAAAGSGIPEVKAYLNGVDAPGIISLRTCIVKIIGSISAVSSSLLVGKAGPMVHTGSCIASLLGQGGSRRYGLTWKWLRFFKNDRDRRDLVTCGSAAGIAAAFRAPVGGVLFALEEMASCVTGYWWTSGLLWRAFFTTAVVAVILRALIDVCLSGKCGLFGKGGLIMFDVYSANISYHIADVPPVLLLGVVGGILGSLYNFLLDKVLRVYAIINEKSNTYKIFIACAISIFTSCLLFGLPWLASCQPCPFDTAEACPTIGRSGNYKKFQCPPGHYNDLASLIFNTNDDAIRNLFSRNTDSDGSFVPVIVTGASYGRFVGMLLGSHSNLNHGFYAVLGAASFLADAFNGNIYDLIMKAKGFPYLKAHAEPYMRQLTVADVVSGPLQLCHGIEKVGNVVHILKTTNHHGFPVIDEPPHSESPVLYGLILRAHLITLLKKRSFLRTPVRIGVEAFMHFSADEFAKKGLGKVDRIGDINLTHEEMEMFLDLHPFTNASPYTVVETMSLAKASTLFLEMGLRHLLVIPKTSNGTPVVGILTRHDFMAEHVLGGSSSSSHFLH
ncbi:putative chloride channel-like protein CLC-g [Hibiscus syriacus]|uniref:Chloride channel protein n=1 Tax=Hibiscus syriacus TaxID=106335 RepID=A0A6A2Z856_HIBSY|nr:putative chloride channel-like protein CLC-g [Hibiscus syriacus]